MLDKSQVQGKSLRENGFTITTSVSDNEGEGGSNPRRVVERYPGGGDWIQEILNIVGPDRIGYRNEDFFGRTIRVRYIIPIFTRHEAQRTNSTGHSHVLVTEDEAEKELREKKKRQKNGR